MADLSPQAQAVLDAFGTYPLRADHIGEDLIPALAAALRAAADQAAPETVKPDDTFCCPPVETIVWKRLMNVRQHLLAIAAELKGYQTSEND